MKRIALALLLSVLLVCSFGLEVCAETVVKDGIEVTLTTDKESYDALDVIDARLTVRNTNEFAVENVSAQITAPEGYALSGSDEVKIGELSAGEAQIQQVDVRNETAAVPALPETGDDSYVVLWGILFVGSAVLCALAIRNPKAKRIVSLFLCIAMTGTMVLEAMPVVAEKQDRRIAVSKQVDVGGKLVTITGTVDYSIEADLAENEESKVTEKIQNTYGYSDGGDNSSQAGWGEVSPMLFAIITAEELKRIAFMDVSYVGFRGNRHTFSWQGGYSDTYIVNVKILDGSPAYTDDEAGTSIVQNKRQSENSIQFVVPADILNGTYIKVHVYGETDGQQTESGNQIYMQIGGDCEHPWMDRISNYDTVYIPVDEEEHQIAGHSYSYCGNCGVLIYEEITPGSGNQEHSFSNNTNMCTRCGYKQELACDHDFISVPGQRYSLVFPLLDENPTYHQISVGYTLACSKCGEETSSYVSGMDEHEFNSENECICGYALDVSCEHQAPEREQVGDTVYEQYSPQIGDYSQFFHMAINTYRTKCSVCGIVSEETTDEIETENHVYDENRICIYCGDEARTEGGISAPELSDIVSSAGDTVNSGSKSTFSTTIRDDRVLSYIGVYFDGILQEEYINPPILADESFELAWTCLFSKRLGDQHVITFAACDSDGNWAEKEYTITVVCDHENVETQDWGYKNEKIEGNDKIHHVVSTKITKCLECGEEIDREVTKGTEAHKFVDMYCTLCGYDISGCLHDTCKDEYNPDIPIQYKDNGDGKTHTWQNGYDCTCLTCGRVTQVYGEEQIAEHDYSTGNVCPCGFDVVPPCSGRFDFSRDPISGDASDINNVILNFEAGSAITFTLGAGDNVQLAKLELFRDGVLVNQMDCNVNYGELTYTTEELTPGKFVLKLVATDAVGLTTTFIFNINVIGSDCTHIPGGYTYKNYIFESIADDNKYHNAIGIIYDVTCALCQTVYREETVTDWDDTAKKAFPYPVEHDVWKDGVCGTCGYECVHPEKNENGEINYSDKNPMTVSLVDNKDGQTHTHTYNVTRTCLTCQDSWTQKIYDPTEVHNIRELTEKGVYNYDADAHWLEVPVGCSCGYRTEEVVTKDKTAHNPQVTTTYRYDPDGNVHQVWEIKSYDCVCGRHYDPEEILKGPSGHSDYNGDRKCDYCESEVEDNNTYNENVYYEYNEERKENIDGKSVLLSEWAEFADESSILFGDQGIAIVKNAVGAYNVEYILKYDKPKEYPEGYYDIEFDVYSDTPVVYGITVHDKKGKIVGDTILIDQYSDKFSIVDEVITMGVVTKEFIVNTGNLFKGETEFAHKKTTVKMEVPVGGYFSFEDMGSNEDVYWNNAADLIVQVLKVKSSLSALKIPGAVNEIVDGTAPASMLIDKGAFVAELRNSTLRVDIKKLLESAVDSYAKGVSIDTIISNMATDKTITELWDGLSADTVVNGVAEKAVNAIEDGALLLAKPFYYITNGTDAFVKSAELATKIMHIKRTCIDHKSVLSIKNVYTVGK